VRSGYRDRMVQIRQDESGRWAEVVPIRCGNGHPLGVGRMSNSMGEHPIHHLRVRTWTCNTCGDVTYADPDPGDLPRGQHGPTADYS
jgi:hypothetical protein